MRKMHHLKQDLFYYVGMILGDLFVIFVTEMILNVGIMKNVKEQEFIYKMNEAKSEK